MCNVLKGDEPVEIEWTLNGELITQESHPDILITKSGKKLSILNIGFVAAHHAGEYTCIASNRVGSLTRSAVLSINGA